MAGNLGNDQALSAYRGRRIAEAEERARLKRPSLGLKEATRREQVPWFQSGLRRHFPRHHPPPPPSTALVSTGVPPCGKGRWEQMRDFEHGASRAFPNVYQGRVPAFSPLRHILYAQDFKASLSSVFICSHISTLISKLSILWPIAHRAIQEQRNANNQPKHPTTVLFL